MIKKQRQKKISINTMLIFLDIILLILVTQDIFVKHIFAYGMIKVALIPFISIFLKLKILTTMYKLIRGGRLISRIHKIFTAEKCTSEYFEIRSSMFKLSTLLVGSSVFMYLFSEITYMLIKLETYVIKEWLAKSYSPNVHFVMIGLILVGISLECIIYYVNSKSNSILSLLKIKKDVVTQ